MAILDHRGRPFSTAPSRGASRPQFYQRLRAYYDAARTTDENERHWANADALSADAAASPIVRQKIRIRARYEAQQSNSFMKGLVLRLANEAIGVGPRLQLLTNDPDFNTFVEQQFAAWMRATFYARKLRTGRIARAVDGERFALLTHDENLPTPVKLNVQVVECDRVRSPLSHLGLEDDGVVDGVRLRSGDEPEAYWFTDRHPGDLHYRPERGRWIPADRVIHRFRHDRPGQTRGVSELAPALPLVAMLRRYTLAALAAAETAADFAAVLESDLPPDEQAETLGRDDWFDAIPVEYRAMLTLPQGYKLSQLKAEQPTTGYKEFKREIQNEIACCVLMPRNVSTGDSSDYNYASGRLDKQAFERAIDIDRQDEEIEDVDRVFREWFSEARVVGFADGAPGYAEFFPDGAATPFPPHRWFWQAPKHVDPDKEARAAVRLWEAGLLTDDEYLFREGVDPDEHYLKLAEQIKKRRELGLPLPGGITLPPGATPAQQAVAAANSRPVRDHADIPDLWRDAEERAINAD
ncbi:phage portal protein [Alienimonas sp. DA493]|uniref:phage portal protein n=1 Tax=Alienimonas sp. DA493 TaxID=3373605 RepID=UPI003754F775